MNSRTFIGMAAAAVTFIVLAVLLTQSRDRSTSAAASDERLFPALAETINEISSVVVEHPDGTLTLERDGTDWGLAEKGGYPVDGAKVRALLLGLVDATKVEVKTASADRYEMLGVQDLDREGADGTRVTLEGGAGTPLTTPAEDEMDHRWPRLLPGGDSVLFTASMAESEHFEPRILSLETGEIERMLGDDSMSPFLVEREACRREHGQATFVVGRRPRP